MKISNDDKGKEESKPKKGFGKRYDGINPYYIKSGNKSGRWLSEDIDEVKRLINEGMTYEQIAVRMKRNVSTVKKLVENKLFLNITEDAKHTKEAEVAIRHSPEWTEIAKQLTPEEQKSFLYHWREMIAQFKGDVTHTEKLQIIDMVRNDILINRVLHKIYQSNATIDRLRQTLAEEMIKSPEERETSKLIDCQKQEGDISLAIATYNREYKELMERKQRIMVDIKGTRDQRLKRIEESKESITGWVASLMASPELRNKLGVYMEKFRIAQQVEFERLSDYHTYIDGAVEQPILSHETLKEDNV